MPLLERTRVEVYQPDLPSSEYQDLLRSFEEELTYAFGGQYFKRFGRQLSVGIWSANTRPNQSSLFGCTSSPFNGLRDSGCLRAGAKKCGHGSSLGRNSIDFGWPGLPCGLILRKIRGCPDTLVAAFSMSVTLWSNGASVQKQKGVKSVCYRNCR